MLAQNFKTPTDLGITDAEFDALVKVLGMLERGELVDAADYHRATLPNGFNMACTGRVSDCGTVACIGGWVALLLGNNTASYVNGTRSDSPLYRLYWPRIEVLENARVAHAAIAVRNFLTVGTPHWREALAVS